MDLKQSPFSLYDFLGYFFPGAAAIYGFAYALKYLDIGDALSEFAHLAKASELLPFVLVAYVTGHFISLVSSFTVERYFIWHFDYPSKSLLRYESHDFLKKGFAFSNVTRLFVWIILLPITTTTALICFFGEGRPGLINQLDPLLSKIIRKKVTGLIVERGQVDKPNHYGAPKTSDFFRVVYHYTLENAPAHFAKMQNYVALFGFNRAMTIVFVGLFWMGVASVLLGSGLNGLRLIFFCYALANIFFFGFAKFYRRFSLESLMAFATVYQIPGHLVGMKLPKPEDGKKIQVGIEVSKRRQVLSLIARVRQRIRFKERISE